MMCQQQEQFASPLLSQRQRQEVWQRSMARRMEAHFDNEMAKLTKKSKFFASPENDGDNQVALFHRQEVIRGACLGKGAFSRVSLVGGFRLCNNKQSAEQEETRTIMEENAVDEENKPRYVIKHMRMGLAADRKRFCEAATGLMVEAKFLSHLDHPYILKLRGVASQGTSSFNEGHYDGFFLILDRLEDTLASKINKWRLEKEQQVNRRSNPALFLEDEDNFAQRLRYGQEIAEALRYLHTRRLVFRDLKPDNIGIKDDHIQLFDFGLCRELPRPCYAFGRNELYQMTMAGTVRYMAPEVCKRRGYNLKVDVYSWAMVFYEMMTLQTPYSNFNRELHHLLVCEEGVRPKLDNQVWPEELVELLELSWSHDIQTRLDTQQLCERLTVAHSLLLPLSGDGEEDNENCLNFVDFEITDDMFHGNAGDNNNNVSKQGAGKTRNRLGSSASTADMTQSTSASLLNSFTSVSIDC